MFRILPGLIAAVLSLSAPALAQVKYVDEAGATHWVGSVDMVPEKYRDHVTQPKLPAVLAPRGDGAQRFLDESGAQAPRPQAPASSVAPSSRQPEVDQADLARAAGFCRAYVNRTGGRGFKANVDAAGGVNTLANASELYKFNECMANQGHVLR